jgi:hypothetical protein
MFMNPRSIPLLCAALLAAAPVAALAGSRAIVIPLQGLARAQAARTVLQSAIAIELRTKGWEVVDEEKVEGILRELRIRYLDSLTPGQLALILSRTGSDTVVFGTVLDYVPAPEAAVALHVQAVDRTGTLWSRIFALRGSQAVGPLGEVKAKSPDELAALVLLRELADFPRAGEPFPPPRLEATGTPSVLFARDLPSERPRVAVLPFANRSLVRRAGAVAEAAIVDALSRSQAVSVVQPALLRSALVAAGLQSLADLGPEGAGLLAASVGTTLFVQGTILRYDPGVPEVELHVTLTDLASGRVYWSGLQRRRGSDFEDWLSPGTVKDPARLTSLAVGELIKAFTAPGRPRRSTKPEER